MRGGRRDRGEDLRLELAVEVARRPVEQENRRAVEYSADQRDPLALPAGQRDPVVTQNRVASLRQLVEEPVHARETANRSRRPLSITS